MNFWNWLKARLNPAGLERELARKSVQDGIKAVEQQAEQQVLPALEKQAINTVEQTVAAKVLPGLDQTEGQK